MENYRREYVDVNVDHLKNGLCYPRKVRTENGQVFNVDRIVSRCRAASTKVGGCGVRYTVNISGKEVFLFDEENGKWFVEVKN